MYIVGIDIGKNHHEASIVSPEGKQIGRSLRFATTHKGADSLRKMYIRQTKNDSIDSFLIAEVIRFGQFTTTSMADENILAEIGDINRFKSSSALVAFAGIDPTVRQSGEFSSTHNHMSKRGSPYLRHAIFLATTTCSFHNSPLNAYYKKKRDQGKHHLTATGAVARKLTTVIYAVLRDSKPYEPKSFC